MGEKILFTVISCLLSHLIVSVLDGEMENKANYRATLLFVSPNYFIKSTSLPDRIPVHFVLLVLLGKTEGTFIFLLYVIILPQVFKSVVMKLDF